MTKISDWDFGFHLIQIFLDSTQYYVLKHNCAFTQIELQLHLQPHKQRKCFGVFGS